jgi:hypothetical protein
LLSKEKKKQIEDEYCYAQKRSDWEQCDKMKAPLKHFDQLSDKEKEWFLAKHGRGSIDVMLYCPGLPPKKAGELGKCPPPEVCKKTASTATPPTDTDTATEAELKAACYPGFPCHKHPASKPRVNKSNPT